MTMNITQSRIAHHHRLRGAGTSLFSGIDFEGILFSHDAELLMSRIECHRRRGRHDGNRAR